MMNRGKALIAVFDTSKIMCIKKVRALEERGYECVHPIRAAKISRVLSRNSPGLKSVLPTERVDVKGWGTKMRKVEQEKGEAIG